MGGVHPLPIPFPLDAFNVSISAHSTPVGLPPSYFSFPRTCKGRSRTVSEINPVPQRVQYKLAVMVHRCLGRQAPSYLADYCVPVSTVPGRQHLRSASRRQLAVAVLSVLVLSPLQAQQFGILCQTVCVIQLLGLIDFDVT